jgi:hypothetical protein
MVDERTGKVVDKEDSAWLRALQGKYVEIEPEGLDAVV